MPRLHLFAAAALWAVLLPAAACTTEPDDPHARAIVYGRIATAAGAPLPRYSVWVIAHQTNDCSSEARASYGLQSADDGSYRVELGALATAFTACVSVSATPSPISSLAYTASAPGVHFREGSATPDSVRVDVTFPGP